MNLKTILETLLLIQLNICICTTNSKIESNIHYNYVPSLVTCTSLTQSLSKCYLIFIRCVSVVRFI